MDVIPDIAWAILLLLIGFALVVLEVFIPSGGIIAILSGVALIAALVMAFQESSTTGPMIGFIFALVTVFAVPSIVALAFKLWPKTPIFERLTIRVSVSRSFEPRRKTPLKNSDSSTSCRGRKLKKMNDAPQPKTDEEE